MLPLREHPLPANPNCVAFATPNAGALFDGRSWADLQQIAATVVRPFHAASRLPILAGYAWRSALSRKNERQTHGLMYFVFDGPATSDHLDMLARSVAAVGSGFGPACIERSPANGAPAVFALEREVFGVLRLADDGELWTRRIEQQSGRIAAVDVPASVAAMAVDSPDDLPNIVGLPAPYSAADQEVERLRLAFAMAFTDRIVKADGVVRPGERDFVQGLFPPDLVQALGLSAPADQEEYFASALERLPGLLGHHDKLALVGLFFSACYSDGSLDAREMRVLKEAGEAVGLTREEVVEYLRRFW